MKKHLLYFTTFLAILLLGGSASGWAQTRFFVEAPDLKEVTRAEKNVSVYRVYRLDVAALRTYLANAPVEFTADARPALRLAVPLPNGTTETFAIYDSPILAPVVAAQYPNIKTYTGQAQTAGSTAVIRFSFTGDEFNAIVLGLPGAGAAYFEKSTAAPGVNVYLSYSTLDVLPATGSRAAKKNPCGVQPLSRPINVGGINRAATGALRTGGTLRTLRLAITATGEFTNAKGTPNNTAAGGYAAVVQYVNRLVAVYRRELSVSFVLVSTASVVYPDPATDPFLTPTANGTVLPVSQSVLDNNVGDANYDIGHTLGYGGAGSGGGLAQGSSVCSSGSKAQAVSDVNEGNAGQFPAVFGDQVFCHEVGHQVGMNHSYNSSIPVCTTRNPDTSVEPGAGTTIMSYGYTCADATDPAKNDDYETGYLPFLNFHAVNLAEATAFLGTISCYTTTNTGNSVPVITAFTTGRTIPKSTPFALTGTATDADAGNVLSYSWEGMDAGAPAATPPGPTVLGDPAQAPFFRSYEPAATITRLFPRLASILDGTNQAKGDKLPSVGRVVNLRLTVRDNVNGANEASSAITIDGNSGPFLITSNLAGSYPGNTPQTVTWSVNNTTAAPVSCANVDILLSTDGGLTFPITLLTATPNDGTEPVTMPVLPAAITTARIKVQASNNIFFDISNTNFSITAPLNTVGAGTIAGSPFCTGTAVSVPYSASGTFAAGNTFEAQLSDAMGGFGAPVAIGSVSSVVASGTIAAVIPTGTAAGTGYRIRVVASNPATAGTDNGANITISAPAVATFSYGPTGAFCTSRTAAQAAVAGTGATLGSFSVSPATGLTLDAATGAITASSSTPGTYMVTNTVAASGGCAAATATSTVSIAAPQTAGFAYTAASYCTSTTGPVAAGLATGATAGAFTSTAGLTLDAATGAITASSSTPGTYTVTNTVAASNGCAAVTATSTVSIAAPQTAGFGYAAASYCTSTTGFVAAGLTTGATAGTFSSTAGLTLNIATGAITPSSSTPGTYTVTNTVAAAGGCAGTTATSTVAIAAPQTASFSYGVASYCTSTIGVTTATLATGATAGAFTSTAGLMLNATTGAITASTSTPGTYTVTNTVAASGGCAAVTATSTVSIAAPQTAGFSYGSTSAFCTSQTAAQAAVAGSGATLGTFTVSPTTGLTLNAATGAITVSTSTPGTYTVTNTVAASSGCAAVTATSTVSIAAPQTAGFAYAAASYCTSATGPVAVGLTTGATAGAFTSTAGLTLNAVTGAITPSASTPGTYTVTNTVAASGGCAAVTATSMVSIAAPQLATFAYPASSTSYCSGAVGPLTPTLGAGAVAGAFTLVNGTSTGATIDPTTGVVNVSAATAGTFTVSNTLAASGGCASVVATQTLTVLPLPATPVLIAAGTNTVTIQGGAVAGLSYQFRRNGVAVGTASTAASYQVTSAAGSGQYTVVATSAAGCSSAPSAAVTVAFITGTIAQAAPITLLLYPNPAPLGGGATVELRGWTSGPATLTLYDVLGRTMRVTPAASGGTTYLDLSGMASGVYLLRAQAPGQQASRRLVVE